MSEVNQPVKKRAGRPTGSRNKSTLMKAQIKIDDLTLEAVEYLEAMMKNDKSKLDCTEDVPYTIRFNATKEILAKGIANEKDKDVPNKTPVKDDVKESTSTGPRVYASAK